MPTVDGQNTDRMILNTSVWRQLRVTLENGVTRCNRMLDTISSRDQRSEIELQELVKSLDEEIRNLRAELEEHIAPF